ncbi:UDP-2,3-diacylglucosamine diphosphatase [Xenophilus arseniciresistens]|uniref:UDP-2,3-diacylglucosamine hydrolase n=1 Tax=Xenophilus arseniciresistens TaxID=1283306 RepID=A0AAE3SZF4_9BURK|nr:UDP-2,3-diacylglucosamine diphosphatase [Xenophilus arseniciresistens]MDA7415192.1 UDP-2,3-diacylglucosamine diphosphatase [Xenophilus arseniciresistens]
MAEPLTQPVLPSFAQLQADAGWRSIEFISDLHLEAGEPATFECWRQYLASSSADAIFILGDLFEVWVGDDAAAQAGFEADCARWLREAGQGHQPPRPLFFVHGNRDFLIGPAFAAQAGLTLLDDPTVLHWQGQRWLLSHGDLLCLEDRDYLAFRAQVRTPAWQQAFLSRPLQERRTIARGIRNQSEAHKADPKAVWADVDDAAARQWLQAAGARTLIHGHTHRPADHALGQGLQRRVLSDWHADASPPRAQVLRLTAQGGVQRIDLLPAAP